MATLVIKIDDVDAMTTQMFNIFIENLFYWKDCQNVHYVFTPQKWYFYENQHRDLDSQQANGFALGLF